MKLYIIYYDDYSGDYGSDEVELTDMIFLSKENAQLKVDEMNKEAIERVTVQFKAEDSIYQQRLTSYLSSVQVLKDNGMDFTYLIAPHKPESIESRLKRDFWANFHVNELETVD